MVRGYAFPRGIGLQAPFGVEIHTVVASCILGCAFGMRYNWYPRCGATIVLSGCMNFTYANPGDAAL